VSAGPRILWLEGVFDEATIDSFPAISPAVNFWHTGFVKALEVAGCEVTLMGHAHDRIWPKGRAVVHAGEAKLAPGFAGQAVGYLNLPALRARTQAWNYLSRVKAHLAAHGRPDFVVTFNDTPATPAARFLSRELGVPWLFISGDGPVIAGADGYLYQNWVYFESSQSPGPKIHLDGGLPLLDPVVLSEEAGARPCALMYMGALTAHGGAVELVRGFHALEMPEAELWITGRGSNEEIERLAAVDPRIKLYGFVNQKRLHELASRARVFANPRPTTFAPNKLNYPSKLLHYLAYGRPVLSTFTDGLSPDYREVLIPMEEESEAGIAASISYGLGMPDAEYAGWCARVSTFNASRAWNRQIVRLLEWMRRDLKRPPSVT
jgi:hypothetical protein